MNRNQYAVMLQDINTTRINNGDISACIAKYRNMYKYVYVYNDSCFKRIFSNNTKMSANFLNAVLKFDGADCIDDVFFINPSIPGGPFLKTITSDLVCEYKNHDRIVVEVQHKGDDEFKDRVVFYTARHTIVNKVPGLTYKLRNLNFIALQMFNTFPGSQNYRHTVRLKNQENETYFDKETLTLVEIEKFRQGKYENDNGALAQWLRAIDSLNNEQELPTGASPYFLDLQESSKLCNFDEEYFITEAKSMTDHDYELQVERKEARAEGLAEGRAEGLAEGLAEGRAEGLAEGRAEAEAKLAAKDAENAALRARIAELEAKQH